MSYTIDELVEASDNGWLFTEDGRKVRIICTNRRSKNFPLVGLIEKTENEVVCYFTLKGKFSNERHTLSDLVIKKPKTVDWEKVMKHGGYGVIVSVKDSDRDSWFKGVSLWGYAKNRNHPFITSNGYWQSCKFPDGFAIPDEWCD